MRNLFSYLNFCINEEFSYELTELLPEDKMMRFLKTNKQVLIRNDELETIQDEVGYDHDEFKLSSLEVEGQNAIVIWNKEINAYNQVEYYMLMRINKLQDDWWTVFNFENRKWWLCDEIDGLIKFLNQEMNSVK